MKGLGGLYEIRVCDGEGISLVSCRAKGILHRNEEKLLIGDEVTVKIDDSLPDGVVISSVAKRRNELIRPPMSNLDLLFVSFAVASPEPALETVDKLIAIAEYHAILPVIVITKCDLNAESAAEYLALYKNAGFDAFAVSSVSGEGIAPLSDFIASSVRDGKSAAFAGASGVGKSSLLNRLFPHFALATSEISKKIERGRHTTRHVELFPLSDGTNCGFFADTPGFSLIDFEHFDFFPLDSLLGTFRDLVPYIGKCRYADCAHFGEGAEECAIARAAEEGKIAPSRLASYRAIYQVLKNKKNYS